MQRIGAEMLLFGVRILTRTFCGRILGSINGDFDAACGLSFQRQLRVLGADEGHRGVTNDFHASAWPQPEREQLQPTWPGHTIQIHDADLNARASFRQGISKRMPFTMVPSVLTPFPVAPLPAPPAPSKLAHDPHPCEKSKLPT
jgi:hypothetical protein